MGVSTSKKRRIYNLRYYMHNIVGIVTDGETEVRAREVGRSDGPAIRRTSTSKISPSSISSKEN